MQEWLSHVEVIARKYNLDPNLCAALAAGESGKGKQEVRFGPVCNGKYYAPYNIHQSALKKWNITDWKVNTEVGIMLLSKKLKKSNGNLWSALRTYNTGDRGKKYNRYISNIKRLQSQYKKRKVFDESISPIAKLGK